MDARRLSSALLVLSASCWLGSCQPVTWTLRDEAQLTLSTEAVEVTLVTVTFDGRSCVSRCGAAASARFRASRGGAEIASPSARSPGGELVLGPVIIPADESLPPAQLCNELIDHPTCAPTWTQNVDCTGRMCEVVFSVETTRRPLLTDPFDSELSVSAVFSGEGEDPAGASIAIEVE